MHPQKRITPDVSGERGRTRDGRSFRPDTPIDDRPIEAADMTEDSIATKGLHGAGWAFCWRLATRILGLVSTLILVRLLAPGDFGLVALASAFAGAIDALSNIGAEYALIREKSPDRALYDTAFTLNLLRGAITGACIAVAAVPVAAFLNEPRLGPVLWVLAAVSALASGENIGVVDFRRQFAFAQEFKLFLVPRIFGIATNIACALLLRSYWALVFGVAVTRIGRLVFSYMMHPYRPAISLRAWRQLIGFSFWVWAGSMVSLIRGRSDSFVIGRLLDPTRVGFFTVGTEVAALPATEVLGPVARSLFPAFAALEHRAGSMGHAFLRVVSAVMIIVMPACVGLSLLADPLIKLAFGPGWLEAIPVVRIVAVTGIFYVITQTAGNALGARGEMRLMFWLSVPGASVRIPLMAIMVITNGLLGASLAQLLLLAIETLFYAVVTARRLDFRVKDVIVCMWRCIAATLSMTLVLAGSGLGWADFNGDQMALVLYLVGSSLLGVAVFVATLGMLWLGAGRPDGAETMLVGTIIRQLARPRRSA